MYTSNGFFFLVYGMVGKVGGTELGRGCVVSPILCYAMVLSGKHLPLRFIAWHSSVTVYYEFCSIHSLGLVAFLASYACITKSHIKPGCYSNLNDQKSSTLITENKSMLLF